MNQIEAQFEDAKIQSEGATKNLTTIMNSNEHKVNEDSISTQTAQSFDMYSKPDISPKKRLKKALNVLSEDSSISRYKRSYVNDSLCESKDGCELKKEDCIDNMKIVIPEIKVLSALKVNEQTQDDTFGVNDIMNNIKDIVRDTEQLLKKDITMELNNLLRHNINKLNNLLRDKEESRQQKLRRLFTRQKALINECNWEVYQKRLRVYEIEYKRITARLNQISDPLYLITLQNKCNTLTQLSKDLLMKNSRLELDQKVEGYKIFNVFADENKLMKECNEINNLASLVNYNIEILNNFDKRIKRCDELIEKEKIQLEELGSRWMKAVQLAHQYKIPSKKMEERHRTHDDEYGEISKELKKVEHERHSLNKQQAIEIRNYEKEAQKLLELIYIKSNKGELDIVTDDVNELKGNFTKSGIIRVNKPPLKLKTKKSFLNKTGEGEENYILKTETSIFTRENTRSKAFNDRLELVQDTKEHITRDIPLLEDPFDDI